MVPHPARALLATAALSAAFHAPATAAPREWTLDLGHAHVGWEIDHMLLARTRGEFTEYDGTFLIDEEDLSGSSVTFSIDAASIHSNHVGRDNHVRAADYLDVERHPTIDFASTSIELLTPTSGKMRGELTLRGVTAPITLDFELAEATTYPAFIPDYDEVPVMSFQATGEILRLDHGMDFIAFLGSPTGLSVDLDLRVDLVDCSDVPETNIPCHWGRVEGFVGPSES